MLILRDMKEQDIEDYVRWFTSDTEWGDWDAPWENILGNGEQEERRAWTEYYAFVKDLPADDVRRKFEIESDGKHIGWISSYTDLGYIGNEDGIRAIGLDIPRIEDRNKGYGAAAFRMYMDHLRAHGHRSFYTQTWSGNLPMVRLAEKLGFREIVRIKGLREVRGRLYDALTFRLDL